MPEDLKIKAKTKISQIYRKLDPSKPSYTITAAGGGGTFGYHWDNRELTNRERARIQTFRIITNLQVIIQAFVSKLNGCAMSVKSSCYYCNT